LYPLDFEALFRCDGPITPDRTLSYPSAKQAGLLSFRGRLSEPSHLLLGTYRQRLVLQYQHVVERDECRSPCLPPKGASCNLSKLWERSLRNVPRWNTALEVPFFFKRRRYAMHLSTDLCATLWSRPSPLKVPIFFPLPTGVSHHTVLALVSPPLSLPLLDFSYGSFPLCVFFFV